MSKARECPKCHEKKLLTKHHIIPRKLWRNTSRESIELEDLTIEICRECHNELNVMLDRAEWEFLFYEFQSRYIEILRAFLQQGGIPCRASP